MCLCRLEPVCLQWEVIILYTAFYLVLPSESEARGKRVAFAACTYSFVFLCKLCTCCCSEWETLVVCLCRLEPVCLQWEVIILYTAFYLVLPSESEARGKRVAFAACTLPRFSLQVVYVLLFRMRDVGRVFVPTWTRLSSVRGDYIIYCFLPSSTKREWGEGKTGCVCRLYFASFFFASCVRVIV